MTYSGQSSREAIEQDIIATVKKHCKYKDQPITLQSDVFCDLRVGEDWAIDDDSDIVKLTNELTERYLISWHDMQPERHFPFYSEKWRIIDILLVPLYFLWLIWLLFILLLALIASPVVDKSRWIERRSGRAFNFLTKFPYSLKPYLTKKDALPGDVAPPIPRDRLPPGYIPITVGDLVRIAERGEFVCDYDTPDDQLTGPRIKGPDTPGPVD